MRNAPIRWSRPGNNLPLLVSLMVAGSLLLPAVVRAAPPAFVQMTYRAITSGGSIAVALPKQNTAGNLIVVYVVWDSADAVSLTDTRGNPYISAVGHGHHSDLLCQEHCRRDQYRHGDLCGADHL